jgi:hypothetical protein
MNTLHKTVYVGKELIGERREKVFCSVKIKEGKLSISGVVGPTANGSCKGSCGQIVETVAELKEFAPGWNKKTKNKFVKVWERWHLNHMNAGCAHQRELWNLAEKVTFTTYIGTIKFFNLRTQASKGLLTLQEYSDYQKIADEVSAVTTALTRPKHPRHILVKKLLGAHLIKAGKTEEKVVSWVKESEHPKGCLSKPCPICGYKYGSSWLKEDLPQNVIDFLRELPDSTETPAWI